MKVTIRLHEASEPLVFEDVRNTYTKGPLFCMRLADKATLKWPLVGIFNIREEKGFTSQKKTPVMPYTVDIETPKPEPEPAKDGLPDVVWARIYSDGSGHVYRTESAAMRGDLGNNILLRLVHNCDLVGEGDDNLWHTLVDRLRSLSADLSLGQTPPTTKIVVKEPPRTAPTYAACGKNTGEHCAACTIFDKTKKDA